MASLSQRAGKKAAETARAGAEDFLTIAVHDLKETFRGIRMGADRAASAEETEKAQGLKFVSEGMQRAETLVHDIAAYCKQELSEVALESVSLESVLKEALRIAADELRSCDAHVVSDPLPQVLGMYDALTTVFTSLLKNACRFRNDTPVQIQITATRKGNECIVGVSDTGIGIDSRYSDRIFQPFEKLNGRKYPGSGLGLALCRMIVEQQGGRIWAESRLGQGATVKIALSVLEEDNKARLQPGTKLSDR